MKNNNKKNRIGKKQANRKQTGTNNGGNHGARQDFPVPAADVPADWFYMSDGDITAATLKEALADTVYKVEFWEDAQVLEIALGESGCLDVEVIEPRMEEKEADAFLEKHQVKFLCYITFKPENYEAARSVMEHICGRIGGFFCGDTEDFTPLIGRQ